MLIDAPYEKKYDKGYCVDCGDPIEKEGMEAAMRRGGVVKDCLTCMNDRMKGVPSTKRIKLISSLA